MTDMTDQTLDRARVGSARTALADLRPQPFGNTNPSRVRDPLVEPLWAGVRVLAAVESEGATLVDETGDVIEEHPDIAAALAEARLAEHMIVDGYLTKMTLRDQSGVYVAMDDLPTSSQLVSRPLLGIRRTRAEEATKAMESARIARTFGPDDEVSFVAVDLLWLDGEFLLDIPLLERRRILESALAESELVRRGVFVRPPLDAWIGSWRALGFTGISLKGANSRYQPGVVSNEWASAPMPRR
jgi:ATP dependent DNA ligase-like protein